MAFARRVSQSVHSASDDIESSDKIRTLLKDIQEARQAKSRAGVSQIDHSELTVSLHTGADCH